MSSSPQRDLLEAVVAAERTTRKLNVVLPLERRVRRALSKTWKLQAKRVLVTLARFAGDFPDLEEAVDPTELGGAIDTAVITDPSLVAAVQVIAESALVGGAESAQLDLSIEGSFSVDNPEAVAWLTQYGARRVAGIDDITRQYLRTVLTNAADEGWSYSRTAAAIKERFVQFAVGVPQDAIRSRAELVAVTEVGEAYEQGANIVAKGLQAQGLTIEKSWLDVEDESECPICEGNASDGWIDESAVYESGDDAPPAHPACRCTNERRVVPSDDGGD